MGKVAGDGDLYPNLDQLRDVDDLRHKLCMLDIHKGESMKEK